MDLFYFMNRRAVTPLDWRPFSCKSCKPYTARFRLRVHTLGSYSGIELK
jgi:hypothetical protein